jgi:hypothetical protein
MAGRDARAPGEEERCVTVAGGAVSYLTEAAREFGGLTIHRENKGEL